MSSTFDSIFNFKYLGKVNLLRGLVEQVKWDDSYGNGEHYWEYNHSDNGYKAAGPSYGGAAAPAYSEDVPVYEQAPSNARIQ
jgi:hypothetical protein